MSKYILETERLGLAEPCEDHLDGWQVFYGDEKVMTSLGSHAFTKEQTWRALATIMGHWKMLGYGFFSVFEKTTGECVGRVGPWNPGGWPAPEIGWTVASQHWGRGFAPEAAHACLGYAKQNLGWSAAAHFITDVNHNSASVAQKMGAKIVGSFTGLPGLPETSEMQFRHFETRL